jgi:hypothetical protein
MSKEKITIEQLALDIADESEASVIESSFVVHILDGKSWYNTRCCDGPESEDLIRAQAYLTLRGLLIRHPDRPELVRIKDSSDLGIRSRELLGQS